jgi:hypothetical protein
VLLSARLCGVLIKQAVEDLFASRKYSEVVVRVPFKTINRYIHIYNLKIWTKTMHDEVVLSMLHAEIALVALHAGVIFGLPK